MKLLDTIKKDRARQKGKKPHPDTAWAAVAAIVEKFGLTAVPGAGEGGEPAEAKSDERLSLFPLLPAEQWRLTKEIMATFDGPYLAYARSPGDFGLSRRLYESHPGLDAQTLRQYSMGELLRRETEG